MPAVRLQATAYGAQNVPGHLLRTTAVPACAALLPLAILRRPARPSGGSVAAGWLIGGVQLLLVTSGPLLEMWRFWSARGLPEPYGNVPWQLVAALGPVITAAAVAFGATTGHRSNTSPSADPSERDGSAVSGG